MSETKKTRRFSLVFLPRDGGHTKYYNEERIWNPKTLLIDDLKTLLSKRGCTNITWEHGDNRGYREHLSFDHVYDEHQCSCKYAQEHQQQAHLCGYPSESFFDEPFQQFLEDWGLEVRFHWKDYAINWSIINHHSPSCI
jgi:hypothetical protein